MNTSSASILEDLEDHMNDDVTFLSLLCHRMEDASLHKNLIYLQKYSKILFTH